jgi:hypothetical protein
MDKKELLVFLDDVPLVVVGVDCSEGTPLIATVLDWYAVIYDFKRSRLNGGWIKRVKFKQKKDSPAEKDDE